MKKLVAAIALLLPLNAMALNVNIGYPVDAARMSLTGETTINLDCKSKTLEVVDSSSVIFDKHLRKVKHVMCYHDEGVYNLRFTWNKGAKVDRYDMIASQPGRHTPEVNRVM